MPELTKAEHDAWMVKLWEAIGDVKSCESCLRSHSQTRCPRCGSTQTITSMQGWRQSVGLDPRKARVPKETDPELMAALRNLYRTQRAYMAEMKKDEQL